MTRHFKPTRTGPLAALRATLSMALLAALLTAQTPSLAAEPEPAPQLTLRIDSQPMGTALKQLADQAGLQVVYPTEVVNPKLIAPALQGKYTAAAALSQLLSGSGLSYHFINSQTVAIRSEVREISSAVIPAGGHQAMHLALVEAPPQSGASAAGNAKSGSDPEHGEDSEAQAGTPEILVKGQRNLNVDIKRTEDAPQPYVVFDKEEIQRSQAVHLEEFLKSRLPMNAAGATYGQTVGDSATQSSSIDLRGLGPDQTLILVNGRRLPNISTLGFSFQADINGIPMAAVERIEVLPSTAGGIYGGSATGGVINVILRNEYTGLDTRITYANTFDGDAANIRMDANAGFSLEGGRTQITLAATRAQANDLMVRDRDFHSRGLALQLQNNPTAITGASFAPLGATVNIRSADFDPMTNQRLNLTLDPGYGGTSLGSTITHLPMGYAGPDSDGGAALIANANQYNLAVPEDMSGGQLGLFAGPSLKSASINVRREFTSYLDVFLDLSQLGNIGSGYYAAVPSAITLPANAPNNPFQQAIDVRFPTPNLSFRTRTESITRRATAGLIFRLPGHWTGEIDYNWSRARLEQINTFFVADSVAACVLARGVGAGVDPDGAGPLLPCAAGDSRPALNILQEGNTFPIDFGPYQLPSPNQFIGPFDTTLKDATLRLSGPVFDLSGGPLTLSTLVERREETLEDAIYQDMETTRDVYYLFYPQRSQDADSYYLEARAPLISSKNAQPWARALELQASVRHDKYETRAPLTNSYYLLSIDELPGPDYSVNNVKSTDYTFAIRYAPLQDVAFRASIGTGFIAPSTVHIAPRVRQAFFSLGSDPKRGFNSTFVGQPFTWISGGNPNLNPEQSESWSAGMVLTPRFAPALRLSLDYTRIEKTDEIYTPPWQFFLDYEDNLPEGRIQRGPNLPTDQPGWAGPITHFDASFLNASSTSLEAYDIQADYAVATDRWGAFRWYAVASWQPHYRGQVLPGTPFVENVGYSFGPLEWRGNLGVTWDRGPLSMTWNAQYYNAYRVYRSTSQPAAIDLAILNQGAEWIPDQIYHDLNATYHFDSDLQFAGGFLADVEVSVGVQNLFNESPPILAITSPSGRAYSPYGDPRLRRYTVTISKSFGL